MNADIEDIRRVDVGGLPVCWTPVPGTVMGALLFRVGRADETLRTGGLTHLVEHLALSPIGRRAYQYNGRVEAAIAGFFAWGSREEVLGHLAGVAASLRDLPVDRLEAEKRILETEARTAGSDLDARLLALRFGPVGYGLVNHRELGLGWLTHQDVTTWADERFTSADAVLWLTAEPPNELDIELPAGQPHPPPEPAPIPSLEFPSHLADGTGGVAVSVFAHRSTAMNAALAIAVERARSRLRHDAPLSYAPDGWYVPLDGRNAHVVLNADCHDQDATRVRDELLTIFHDLAERGPTEEELEWDRAAFERSLRDPQFAMSLLDSMARDTLMRVRTPSMEERLRERSELTATGVASAVSESGGSLLVLVPSQVPLGARRDLRPYAPENTELLEGRTYPPTAESQRFGNKAKFVVATRGVSYIRPNQPGSRSWEFSECVAGIRFLSGRLTIVGRDGSSVTLDPHQYERGFEAVETIEDALGEKRIVPISDRERELEPIVREQLAEVLVHVTAEVDLLPEVLAQTEELRILARATRGDRIGLLAVTDRRLLFLFWGAEEQEFIEKPLDEVDAVVKGVVTKKLIVSHGDGVLEFRDIDPSGRATAIARSLSPSA